VLVRFWKDCDLLHARIHLRRVETGIFDSALCIREAMN